MLRFKKIRILFLAIATFFVAGSAAASSSSERGELVVPEYLIKLKTKTAKSIAVNTHLTLIATLVPQHANAPLIKEFKFDARMPAHQHGMVTKAKIKKISTNTFEISGVRFHMSGDWELKFTLSYASGETVIIQSLGFK